MAVRRCVVLIAVPPGLDSAHARSTHRTSGVFQSGRRQRATDQFKATGAIAERRTRNSASTRS
eukprot:13818748-Alexandrium_andersonii.AAC.1